MKTAAIAIIYHGDRILLTKRSPKLRAFPNHWCFVGGKVDDGETIKGAMVREIKEEIGIVVREDDLRPISMPHGIEGYNIQMFETHIEDPRLTINEDEISDWAFFDIFDTPYLELMTKDIVETLRNRVVVN